MAQRGSVPVGKGATRQAFGLVMSLPASAALRVVFTLACIVLAIVRAVGQSILAITSSSRPPLWSGLKPTTSIHMWCLAADSGAAGEPPVHPILVALRIGTACKDAG